MYNKNIISGGKSQLVGERKEIFWGKRTNGEGGVWEIRRKAAGGQTASGAGRYSFVTKRGSRKVLEVRSGRCLLYMPAERGQPISEQSLRAENGICGGALLFCDQKSNQKSLAVSTQRTPTQGASPPRPPKRIKILDFTPKATTGRLLGRNPKFLFE